MVSYRLFIRHVARRKRFSWCELRTLQLIPAVGAMVQELPSPTARTYDDGATGVRGQIVLAEDFRMVSAARQRGALRIPNAAFLISIHHAGRDFRRSPLNVEGSAKCGSLRALVWDVPTNATALAEYWITTRTAKRSAISKR